jgi:hypothetical protein
MITTHASKYLLQMGLDSLLVVCCAAEKCQNSFALANGFAIEVTSEEQPSNAFFCSACCYLNEIPLCCCPRA